MLIGALIGIASTGLLTGLWGYSCFFIVVPCYCVFLSPEYSLSTILLIASLSHWVSTSVFNLQLSYRLRHHIKWSFCLKTGHWLYLGAVLGLYIRPQDHHFTGMLIAILGIGLALHILYTLDEIQVIHVRSYVQKVLIFATGMYSGLFYTPTALVLMPLFLHQGALPRQAMAQAAMCDLGLAIGFVGLHTFILPPLPFTDSLWGYLHWPSILSTCCMGSVMTACGYSLLPHISLKSWKIGYAFLLCLTSCSMIFYAVKG